MTALRLGDAHRLFKHIHNQLLAEVAAVEEDDQGESLVAAKWRSGRLLESKPK